MGKFILGSFGRSPLPLLHHVNTSLIGASVVCLLQVTNQQNLAASPQTVPTPTQFEASSEHQVNRNTAPQFTQQGQIDYEAGQFVTQ